MENRLDPHCDDYFINESEINNWRQKDNERSDIRPMRHSFSMQIIACLFDWLRYYLVDTGVGLK